MVVWRRSLDQSHRYKMFSVVVSWTNNKDPTSDKGIWLFGNRVGSPVQQRGCPSLAEPFSILGTDIKAASTPLEVLTHPAPTHMHSNKDRHAHIFRHTHTHTHLNSRRMQEVCLSRTSREGRQQKQLSVDRNKKNNG